MNQCILFQPAGRPVAVMTPVSETLSAVEVGRKDVPVGLPFWVVSKDVIPEDRTFRDSWELDLEVMGKPDGVGEQL